MRETDDEADMPIISQFYGIIIRMYFDEKHGPHFHAEYGEYAAAFDIVGGQVLAGDFPVRARRLVLTWLRAHRSELLANWERVKAKQVLQKIEPLK